MLCMLLHKYVSVYLNAHICRNVVHPCMQVFMYACVLDASMHVGVDAQMHVCKYACTWVCICVYKVYVYAKYLSICLFVDIYVSMQIYMYLCKYVCMHVCKQA